MMKLLQGKLGEPTAVYGMIIAEINSAASYKQSMKNAYKEEKMFKKFSKVSAISGLLIFVLILTFGAEAGAESYSFTKEIVGQEFIWGPLQGPLDLSVGASGGLYIADTGHQGLVRLDEYGDFERVCFLPGGFVPLGISIDPANGNTYYVTMTDGPTSSLVRFPASSCSSTPVGASAQLSSPYGVDVAPDGSVFVSDTNNDRILKFGSDGTLITTWGSTGIGVPDPDSCALCDSSDEACKEAFCDVKFNGPMGLAVLGNSVLLVADSGNDRIQAFTLDGDFIGAIGSPGQGEWQFNSPEGIAIGPAGNIYIADSGNNRIQKYSIADLSLLAEFGTGSGEGQLSHPGGIAVDSAGSVYVADTNNDRIAVFSPDIVIFENGASSKLITASDPFGATFSIHPDAYWQNAPQFEFFMWLEAFGAKAYWAGLPLNLVLFSSSAELQPLLSVPAGVPRVDDVNLTILGDSSAVPPGTYTLHICLDRNVNGIYNPSASVCGSIDIVRQ